MPISVVLVDDHPIVLQGLQHLFERHDGFTVAACCPDAESALEAVRTHTPDVLVLDLRMPVASGLDLLRRLVDDKLSCRTVLLTAAISDDQVRDAIKLGASGLVLKESPPDALLECVRKVHAGEQWIYHDTLARATTGAPEREAAGKDASHTLTPREV